MQGFDGGSVELEQGLSTGAHHQPAAVGRVAAPVAGDGVGQCIGVGEAAASRSIGADKVGVAEAAHGAGAVAFLA